MSEFPTPTPPPTLPRYKLTALGVVAALIVALPLAQVLRYQNAELHAVLDERAGLDPVARAVALQRGLLSHRDVASKVLRGRSALEPERRLRQVEVDDRLASLTLSLAAGSWERAIAEASELREDWSQLSRRIQARSLNAAESDEAHRLMVEQTLQVIDLVALALAPPGDHGVIEPPTTIVVRALPQIAWRIASLAPSSPGPANSEEARSADATALQLQLRLFDQTLSARADALAERATTLERERAGLLAALAGLLGLALALGLRIARELRRRPADPSVAAAHAAPAAGKVDETRRLLQRLSEHRQSAAAEAQHEPQPTLPPEG